MHSRRNTIPERDLSIQISSSDLDKTITDRRNGFVLGQVQQLCEQYGINVSKQRGKAILTAKRDNMQMIVEKLHFCYVKYTIVT